MSTYDRVFKRDYFDGHAYRNRISLKVMILERYEMASIFMREAFEILEKKWSK